MYLRYIRFLVLSPAFRLRFYVMGALLFFIAFGARFQSYCKKELVQAKAEHALVLSVPQLEMALASRRVPAKIIIETNDQKKEYILEGTGMSEGKIFAIINHAAYSSGENIDNLVIQSIEMGKVVLSDPASGGMKVLYFNDEKYNATLRMQK